MGIVIVNMPDALLFVFCLADGTLLLFLTVYFIITLSDLECDYINAPTCCSKLNKWVIPEIVGHAAISVFLLLTFHWFLCLLTLPLTFWQIYRYVQKPSGNIGVFDPAEIHNRQLLKGYMKEAMCKLGYHLVFFFSYLYSMIVALLSG